MKEIGMKINTLNSAGYLRNYAWFRFGGGKMLIKLKVVRFYSLAAVERVLTLSGGRHG
jgi:hypothetical protein